MGLLTRWALMNDPTELKIASIIVLELIVAGVVLATVGAYIGLLEARGRAHAIRGALEGKAGDEQGRDLLADSVKELKGIFEAVGKMPTARALVLMGGVAFVAATAFAWHTIPDATSDEGPTIAIQPKSVVTAPGGKAFFRVHADGSDLTYRWQRNGSAMAKGANAPTLFISPVKKSENGDRIAVVISNATGEVVSEDVKLTVGKRNKG